jgi:hypothetical protein
MSRRKGLIARVLENPKHGPHPKRAKGRAIVQNTMQKLVSVISSAN